MTQEQLAKMIPAEYRKEILMTNMIAKAQAFAGDHSMFYLFTIWKNYIEPDLDAGCGKCFERILSNFKTLQPLFIKLEQSNNLLEGL